MEGSCALRFQNLCLCTGSRRCTFGNACALPLISWSNSSTDAVPKPVTVANSGLSSGKFSKSGSVVIAAYVTLSSFEFIDVRRFYSCFLAITRVMIEPSQHYQFTKLHFWRRPSLWESKSRIVSKSCFSRTINQLKGKLIILRSLTLITGNPRCLVRILQVKSGNE